MKRSSPILERTFAPRDDIVIREGDHGNYAYLIQSGSVEVFTDTHGEEFRLATLMPGQIFGEMALIFDAPRVASVRALEDTQLIVISRESLSDKLQQSDPTIRALVEMMIDRMVSTNNAAIRTKDETKDLVDATRMIYENIYQSLSDDEKPFFENKVSGKFQALTDAIEDFNESLSSYVDVFEPSS